MVTYFNKTDLVSFGEYLLSEDRKQRLLASVEEEKKLLGEENVLPYGERAGKVYHADIENWLALKN